MGPSDKVMRLVGAGLIPVALIGLALCIATWDEMSVPKLMLIVFAPFALAYGAAAVVDPNIVRAAGKYGEHLPGKYKLIALAVGLVALALSGGLAAMLLLR